MLSFEGEPKRSRNKLCDDADTWQCRSITVTERVVVVKS